MTQDDKDRALGRLIRELMDDPDALLMLWAKPGAEVQVLAYHGERGRAARVRTPLDPTPPVNPPVSGDIPAGGD